MGVALRRWATIAELDYLLTLNLSILSPNIKLLHLVDQSSPVVVLADDFIFKLLGLVKSGIAQLSYAEFCFSPAGPGSNRILKNFLGIHTQMPSDEKTVGINKNLKFYAKIPGS